MSPSKLHEVLIDLVQMSDNLSLIDAYQNLTMSDDSFKEDNLVVVDRQDRHKIMINIRILHDRDCVNQIIFVVFRKNFQNFDNFRRKYKLLAMDQSFEEIVEYVN